MAILKSAFGKNKKINQKYGVVQQLRLIGEVSRSEISAYLINIRKYMTFFKHLHSKKRFCTG